MDFVIQLTSVPMHGNTGSGRTQSPEIEPIYAQIIAMDSPYYVVKKPCNRMAFTVFNRVNRAR
jgi:hypothetical protein